jgi:pheromone a factor receptor
MRYSEIPVGAAIAALLILIPLPSQIRVRNVPLIVLITSTFIINIILIVNSLLWAGHARDIAPIWCDICQSSRTI